MLAKVSKIRRLTVIVSAVLTVCSCAAVADLSGYDTRTVNENAQKSYAQVVSQANGQRVLDTRSDTSRRVMQIFNRLRPYAEAANKTGVPFQWRMSVIRSDEVNAWAMPGGKMAVYTGLVDQLKLNDAEIAAVIGHEMTHALEEHSKNAIGQKVLTQAAGDIAAETIARKTGVSSGTVGIAKDILSEYGIGKPFSRYQEDEADIGGLRLMAQAGYNPEAAITVWEKMNALNSNNDMLSAITSTHPTNNARIASIRKQLPEVMAIYEQSKKPSVKTVKQAKKK